MTLDHWNYIGNSFQKTQLTQVVNESEQIPAHDYTSNHIIKEASRIISTGHIVSEEGKHSFNTETAKGDF